jgi:hypothetical protein
MDQRPDVITAEFWSFMFLHAVWLHNCTPHQGQSESRFTLFTNEDSPLSPHGWFQCFWFPHLCAWQSNSRQINQTWEMERQKSPRSVCRPFSLPCQ